jgi:Xaa-Pro aminopeptidase
MQVWTLRTPARYAYVATGGPLVMFEFAGCQHLSAGLETIDEVRGATGLFYFTAGPRLDERAARWAGEIADLVREHGGGNRRLAVDRVNPEGYAALSALGVEVKDGQEVMERARCIKCPDEIEGLRRALRVCGTAFDRLQEALVPGRTENELWAVLNHTNAEQGGEYIETRLLTSGSRTNPWFHECGGRRIEAGDLVAVDADMIGPEGFFADISRTFLCGDGRPRGEQRTLYQMAHEQIAHNLGLLRPGVSFAEFAAKSWEMPARFLPNRYMSLVHGAGLCGEYPYIPYAEDFERKGYDGTIEAGMTLCVESYIGAEGGREGVKLEQLVVVTERGAEPLSDYRFEERLL